MILNIRNNQCSVLILYYVQNWCDAILSALESLPASSQLRYFEYSSKHDQVNDLAKLYEFYVR